MIGRTMALACALALTAGAARAEMVDVDGGQIYYETCGKGAQAIVLIHDGVVNSASFDDMWPILCRDFRVVRYDRRGYGKSPRRQGALFAAGGPGRGDGRGEDGPRQPGRASRSAAAWRSATRSCIPSRSTGW